MKKCPEGYSCPKYCDGRCGYCGYGYAECDGFSICLISNNKVDPHNYNNNCDNFICIKLRRFKKVDSNMNEFYGIISDDFEIVDVGFECNFCNKENNSIKPKEEIRCKYCNKVNQFTEEDFNNYYKIWNK